MAKLSASVGTALLVVAIVGAVRLADAQTSPERSHIEATFRDVESFASFPQMVANSDGVVLATVVSTLPGPALAADLGPIQQTIVRLIVSEVLIGDVPSTLDLLVDESLINERLDQAGRSWHVPGVRSVFVLNKRDDNSYYRPLNGQSVYIASGTDLIPVYDDEFTVVVGSWSLSQLRAEVATAVSLIEAGAVKPVPIGLPIEESP